MQTLINLSTHGFLRFQCLELLRYLIPHQARDYLKAQVIFCGNLKLHGDNLEESAIAAAGWMSS